LLESVPKMYTMA